MKRVRIESEVDPLLMADCLISLSKSKDSDTASLRRRVFVCKTCNREFSSFQALGGHRASHRKPKLPSDSSQNNATKSKPHECSICGVEFPVGQALGGHMRRHRNSSPVAVSSTPAQPVSDDSDCDSGNGVVGMDLNLTPLENDLVRLQLMAPPLGCFT